MISIIIPVYNAEKTLRRCLDSIESQTYNDWECLLIDDGSTDHSAEICKEYESNDSRFRLIQKENGGASSARNVGLDYVKGEYICFCDADDSAETNWLAVFMEGIAQCDLMVASFNIIKEDGSKTKRTFPYHIEDVDLLWAVLEMSGNGGMLWHKCFRTSIINDNHIRFNEKYKFCEDEEFVSHYAMYAHKTSVSPCPTYNYYSPNYGIKWQNALRFDTIMDIYKNTLSIISIKGQLKKTYAILVDRMLECVKGLYVNRKYGEALRNLCSIQTIVEENALDYSFQKVNRFFFHKHLNISHLIYMFLSLIHRL